MRSRSLRIRRTIGAARLALALIAGDPDDLGGERPWDKRTPRSPFLKSSHAFLATVLTIASVSPVEAACSEWFDPAKPCPGRIYPLTNQTLTDQYGVVWGFGTRQGYNGFQIYRNGQPTQEGEASSLDLVNGQIVARWHDPIPWDPITGTVGIPEYHARGVTNQPGM